MGIHRERKIVMEIKIFRQATELIQGFLNPHGRCWASRLLTKYLPKFNAWVRCVHKYINVLSL